MRTDGVIMPSPCFDQDFGLGEVIKDLVIEQFVAKRSVERFIIAVFPWRSRRDVECLHTDRRQTFPAGLVNDGKDTELPAIMGAACNEVICPDMSRIFRAQPDARSVVARAGRAWAAFAGPSALHASICAHPACGSPSILPNAAMP
jgi:hypothetical protein